MLKYIKTRLEPLTPKLAHEVAGMDHYEGDRRLKPGQMDFLRAKVRVDLFYAPRWSFCWVGKRKLRINGQHSSKMLSDLDGDFPRGMLAVIDEFSADDVEDIAELFGQFDAGASTRTTGELNRAHAACHIELRDVKPTYLTQITAGIFYGLMGGVGSKKMRNDEKAKLLHHHTAFATWASRFVVKPWLGRSSVVGAMFATFVKCSQSCDAFWTLVRDETAKKNHPSRAIADFLRDNMTRKGSSERVRWAPMAFHVKCLHAWNAYRTGTATSLSYYKNAGIPKVL